jgi:2-oxo-4-hydroxy-4-carboxy-5-ureidoimidazoline decarboxylase
MYDAGEEEKLALIQAHPDLAGRAAGEGALSPESTAEQAGAGLDRLTPTELASFSRMNEEYRARFGFPFVICVSEHTKESVLTRFAERLENDGDREIETALAEICKIARLRLRDLVEDTSADERTNHGRLTTHVLDTALGRPASGMEVELWSLAGGEREHLKTVRTDDDGRTGEPLLEAEDLRPGLYELVFGVGDYFAAQGVEAADPPFLDRVPVRFGLADAGAHYHVPLLVSPWAYSTYRGS